PFRLLFRHSAARPQESWALLRDGLAALGVGRPAVPRGFPSGEEPRYLIRDGDGACAAEGGRALGGRGIEGVLPSPHSPWQNPYAARLIGTFRRGILDHVSVLNEKGNR